MSSLICKCFCIFWLFYTALSQPEQEIIFDPMGTSTASQWTYGGSATIPSTASQCLPQNSCFELKNGGWVERIFSTEGFHDIYFKFISDSTSLTGGKIDVKIYNEDTSTLLTDKTIPTDIFETTHTINPSPANLWDDIPRFKIRFEENSGNTYIDSLYIYGVPITPSPTTDTITATPTSSASSNPTKSPSNNPTSNPSNNPTSNPSQNPTESPRTPTNNPTKIPTQAPTKTPSKIPTQTPSKIPTQTPSKIPTTLPTNVPTLNPNSNSISASISPSQMPTEMPRTSAKTDDGNAEEYDRSTTDIVDEKEVTQSNEGINLLSDAFLIDHWYFLIILVIACLCCICIVFGIWRIKTERAKRRCIRTNERVLSISEIDTKVMEGNGTVHVEMEQMSFPSTQIAPGSPTDTPPQFMKYEKDNNNNNNNMIAMENNIYNSNETAEAGDEDEDGLFGTMEAMTKGDMLSHTSGGNILSHTSGGNILSHTSGGNILSHTSGDNILEAYSQHDQFVMDHNYDEDIDLPPEGP